ncbi:MAG TPA: hypothetical protein VEC06_07370 [Paucimonas sp.]|nr:hypothetical protein [Paucimonas sp.]
MRKILFGSLLVLNLHQANAAYTQSTVEAENVAGGTVVADLTASAGSTVNRSSVGIYTWWVNNTSTWTTGSYSLYARASLLPNQSGPKPFGPQVFYNDVNIGGQTVGISNKAPQWIRVTSFDLAQIGGQLRVSDWSDAGLSVDKLAIVKDVSVESDMVAGGTVILDAAASGGKAVTRTSSGVYAWWVPSTSDLAPGDYDVWVKLRSKDGFAHNYSSFVALNDVTDTPVNKVISSTGYQWVKFNSFVYAGNGQSVRISDYSDPNLNVDSIRLIRRTPYDHQSATQALFASGSAALGARELVTFNGVPAGRTAMLDPGRAAFVQASASKIYAYFRQETDLRSNVFQIYMATSTDGGKTFTLSPNPVIPIGYVSGIGKIKTAYDPSVVKRPDGYYMVFEATFDSLFEGTGKECTGFSAVSAHSPDGVSNWQVKSVVACSKMGNNSVSTPSFFVDPEAPETNNKYLQWVGVDDADLEARHYQAPLPKGFLQNAYTFSKTSDMEPYALLPLKAAPDAWDGRNYGASNVSFEDGYFYNVYEGATHHRCSGLWAIGIARTATPNTLSSWTKSKKNPLVTEYHPENPNCWIEYPQILSTPQGPYLYYWNGYINYADHGTSTRTIFRHKILPN